jgi:amidophosphoribosyltransferase
MGSVDELVEGGEDQCGIGVAHSLHDANRFMRELEHRGREAAGIVLVANSHIDAIKWVGTPRDFDNEGLHSIFQGRDYHTFLVHVRYATRKSDNTTAALLQQAQPQVVGGTIYDQGDHMFILDVQAAIVHNGHVSDKYFDENVKQRCTTNSDSEALLHAYLNYGPQELLRRIPGSYTIAIADRDRKDALVIRDRTGIRPGVLGEKDGKYVAASEEAVFRKSGARFKQKLRPGSIYYLSPQGTFRREDVLRPSRHYCFFEYTYIADAESVMNGVPVNQIRRALGHRLAAEFRPDDADYVVVMPRSPIDAAEAYSETAGLPLISRALYKRERQRSFIGPDADERARSIRNNLFANPLAQMLRGKTVVVIDDSTIRGNNATWARHLLFDKLGVNKAYLANYTPRIGIIGNDGVPRGCLFGVDMPPDDAFIVRGRTDEEIAQIIGMPAFFLSVEGLLDEYQKMGLHRDMLCYYCIGGEHPFNGL